jgi:hypothetical protein
MDLGQLPKVQELLEKVLSSRKTYSFCLWRRVIGAVEAMNSPQYIKSIFRMVSRSKLANKKKILSIFSSEHLYEEEEFIEVEFHKILGVTDPQQVVCQLYEFVHRFSDYNYYRCENALTEIKAMVENKSDDNLTKTAISLAKRYEPTLGILYSDNKVKKHEFMIYLHECMKDKSGREEMEIEIEKCIDVCIATSDFVKGMSYLGVLADEFPENKSLDDYTSKIGFDKDENSRLISEFDGEISLAFFGGNEHHRNIVHRIEKEIAGKYSKKISIHYEPCYIGNSSNWGRKLEDYRKIVEQSDLVIIQRDIRTGLGGHLRDYAENKWFASTFQGKASILKKIEYACAYFIKNRTKEKIAA